MTDADEREKDRAFIADQDSWPRWPVLPMKIGGSNPRSAFLVGGEAARACAGWAFVLSVVTSWEPERREPLEFASLDEMFDQGWQID